MNLKLYWWARGIYSSPDDLDSFMQYLIGALTVHVTEEQMRSSIETAHRCMDTSEVK